MFKCFGFKFVDIPVISSATIKNVYKINTHTDIDDITYIQFV